MPPRNAKRLRPFCAKILGEETTDIYRGGSQSEADIENNPVRANPGLRSKRPMELQATLDDSLKRREDVNPGLRSMASRLASFTGSMASKRISYDQLKADFVREVRHLAKVSGLLCLDVNFWTQSKILLTRPPSNYIVEASEHRNSDGCRHLKPDRTNVSDGIYD